MTDQSLRLRVAEALSTRIADKHAWDEGPDNQKLCVHCGVAADWDDDSLDEGEVACCPHYDTDWSATGPEIERLGISVCREPLTGIWVAHSKDRYWSCSARTALLAVCGLIAQRPEVVK